jgi:hypothetical protein
MFAPTQFRDCSGAQCDRALLPRSVVPLPLVPRLHGIIRPSSAAYYQRHPPSRALSSNAGPSLHHNPLCCPSISRSLPDRCAAVVIAHVLLDQLRQQLSQRSLLRHGANCALALTSAPACLAADCASSAAVAVAQSVPLHRVRITSAALRRGCWRCRLQTRQARSADAVRSGTLGRRCIVSGRRGRRRGHTIRLAPRLRWAAGAQLAVFAKTCWPLALTRALAFPRYLTSAQAGCATLRARSHCRTLQISPGMGPERRLGPWLVGGRCALRAIEPSITTASAASAGLSAGCRR